MKKFAVSCLLSITALFVSSQNNCPVNMGFELGNFTNWQCDTGFVSSTSCVALPQITTLPSGPISQRHLVIPPTTISDQYGLFPVTPDGNHVARLGFPNAFNSKVERISYTFTVPTNVTEYSLTYKYALVLQDGNHCLKQQSHFETKIFDVTTNQYVSCLTNEQYPAIGSNGFLVSAIQSGSQPVFYKPWTNVTVLLSDYIGHTLRLEFTNADCPLVGHWAYSYVDVLDACGQNQAVTGNQVCQGQNAVVNGPYGFQSYYWWNSNFTQAFDTTRTLTLATPPTVPTVYALDLIPTQGVGCRDTLFVTVNPATAVPINAGADRSACSGSTTTTIGSPAVAGYSYSWSPATGLSSAIVGQPVATPLTTTSYVLTVTDNVAGCNKKDTVTITVNPQALASFSVNALNTCINGNYFQLASTGANPPGILYNWTFGDGVGTSTQASPNYSYLAAGSYNVKLLISGPGICSDSSQQTVIVAPAATVNGGTDQTICSGASTVIGSAALTGYSYSWVPATGLNSSTLAQPTATPAVTTFYILTATAPGGCTKKDTVIVTVSPKLSNFTINTTTQCITGNNFQFTTTGSNPAGTLYDWSFGNGIGISTQANPNYVYPAAGSYIVQLIASVPSGCFDTTRQTVIVGATAVADAGIDKTICSGTGASTLIGSTAIAGYSYSWTPTTGLNNAGIAQPTAAPAATTSYVVTATTPGGCTKKDTVVVSLVSGPSPAFSINNSTQCITGNSFQYTVSNVQAGATYNWDFGDGTNSAQQSPTHIYTNAGVYNVKLVSTSSAGCQDSAVKTVTVVAGVPPAVISISGNVLTSNALTGNQWYLNGNAISGATGQSHTATASGAYTVIVTSSGCASNVSNSINYNVTAIDPVISAWNLQIVPNPVKDKLVISYNGNHQLDLEILDMTGRRLFTGKGIPNIYAVDLSKFAGGTYLVRLVNSKSKKEVKQLIIKFD